MTPAGNQYITYHKRKYKDQGRRLAATFVEGDFVPVVYAEEEGWIAKENDERELRKLLLKSMQELLRRVEEMG